MPEDQDPLFSTSPSSVVAPAGPISIQEAPATWTKEAKPLNGNVKLSDIPDVELCRRLNERAWAKIALWGAETRSLDDFERKIVATMQQMSVGGWPRDPSPKQAKHAGRIARRAIDRDIITAA
jgi:hypothetical protein